MITMTPCACAPLAMIDVVSSEELFVATAVCGLAMGLFLWGSIFVVGRAASHQAPPEYLE